MTLRLGVSHRWDSISTYYAHYSTGTEPPDNSAFAFFGVTGPAFQLQNLKLTSANQFEIGSKHQFRSIGLDLTTAIYDIKRTNVLTSGPNNPSGPRLQIGQQNARGLELAAAWRVGPRWTLAGNLALISAEYGDFVAGGIDATGNRPRMVPRSIINLGANYRPANGWEIALYGRRVSDMQVNDQNTISVPAHTQYDGFVRCRMTRNTDLTFSVQNIADSQHVEWALPNAGGIALFAPPRTYALAVRTMF